MIALFIFGIITGVFTSQQKVYDDCKKDAFKGQACEVAMATCKVNPKNKCH